MVVFGVFMGKTKIKVAPEGGQAEAGHGRTTLAAELVRLGLRPVSSTKAIPAVPPPALTTSKQERFFRPTTPLLTTPCHHLITHIPYHHPSCISKRCWLDGLSSDADVVARNTLTCALYCAGMGRSTGSFDAMSAEELVTMADTRWVGLYATCGWVWMDMGDFGWVCVGCVISPSTLEALSNSLQYA